MVPSVCTVVLHIIPDSIKMLQVFPCKLGSICLVVKLEILCFAFNFSAVLTAKYHPA
jgi:hypothetical protein